MLALMMIAAVALDDDKAGKIDAETMAALRKKVVGKMTVDRKTGTLQIAYDFRSAKQGNDFQIKGKTANT